MTGIPKDWSSLHILVVEDEPSLLLNLQEVLAQLGLASVTACPTLEMATGLPKRTLSTSLCLTSLSALGQQSDWPWICIGAGVSVGFRTNGNFIPENLKACPMLKKPDTQDEFRSFFRGLVG